MQVEIRVRAVYPDAKGVLPTGDETGGKLVEFVWSHGSWTERVKCNQDYSDCPVKTGSQGDFCDASKKRMPTYRKNLLRTKAWIKSSPHNS